MTRVPWLTTEAMPTAKKTCWILASHSRAPLLPMVSVQLSTN